MISVLLGMATGLIEKLTEEFRSAGPEEKAQFIRSAIDLINVLAQELKVNTGDTKRVAVEDKKTP